MNLVILDGAAGGDAVSRTLFGLGERMGAEVTHFALSSLRLAPCLGDFECWTRTPGLCRTDDMAQDIAAAVHRADLVVFLSPITFGGYSAHLKKAVDRLIGLMHPFFHERDGLTRHLPRYDRHPPILFIGIAEDEDDEAIAIFHELARGNAINLLAPSFLCRAVSTKKSGWADELENSLRGALNGTLAETPRPAAASGALAAACAGDPAEAGPAAPLRSAVVLVGSARPKGTSTSESLSHELASRLEHGGTATAMLHASRFIKAGRQAEQALEAMLAAELLVIAAPLYVDGLPYLVTSALEQLAARMSGQAHGLRRLAGIVNCGYPEAVHNRIAMRMLRHFAHRNGLAWAGGLALGGGEMIHGRSLGSLRFVLPAPRRALRLAAPALAAGAAVPDAAIRLMAKPLLPARLYRWLAGLRWILEGRSNRIGIGGLGDRPWDRPAERVVPPVRGPQPSPGAMRSPQ